ncbi:MAG: hypothetical protein ABI140_10695 [Jatrophihabitantaceae bacterium]
MYRRAWEQKLDPAHRPALPAAVRTYDAAGDTRCVSFDLDCKKKASRATVLRDCERLTGWLAEAGCSFLVDESVSGGRHVYVLLDHALSFAEVAPLARRLRQSGALPSLDPGPLLNMTDGCIRPPGSPHRLGGHQRLITALRQAEAALNRRTSSAAWSAFVAQLPEPAETRLDIDLHAPAAGASLDLGPRRPLAETYLAIATTGIYPPERYPSPSEARGAVVLHALCYGWSPADITAEVRAGRWPGLAQLYRARYSHYREQALAGDIRRAQAHLAENGLQRIHTSAPRSRARGASSTRIHLRRWTAALNLAIEGGRWESQKSYSIELVLLALGDAARRTQTIYPAFGVRHLSMGTGTVVEPSSVAKILKALAGEDDPFVLLIESDRGLDPDVYELRIPDAYLEQLPADHELPPAPIGVHPAFSLLPRTAYRLYTRLEAAGEALTPAELAQAASMPLRTVYATVNELDKAGLLRRRAGRAWTLTRRSLTRYARLNGISTRLNDLVAAWRAERNMLRIAHRLEPVIYPKRSGVAWPGMTRIASRLPGRAAPSEDEILHAADPPTPDWRIDLEEATAVELLQHRLGAVLLTEPDRATWAG